MTIDEFKKNIAPYMKKGWVAMDKDNKWYFYNNKPQSLIEHWISSDFMSYLNMFDIEPVDNWRESLIEVGK